MRRDEPGHGDQHIALGALEHGAQILGLGTLPAVAGRQDRAGEFRRVHAAVIDPLADGGADDQADRAHAVDALVELLRGAGDAIGHGLALVLAALADGGLHARALLVRGQRGHEHAAAVVQCVVDHALQRACAVVRQQGDGVGEHRRPRLEIGVGDGRDRGGQAAVQAVHDGDDLHLAGRIQHAFERGESLGPVPFEHRHLELDRGGATVRGLQHAHREQFGAVGVHVVPPVGEEFPVRVDAHTQWTILVHGILQSQTEIGPAHLNLFTADGLGHRHHDLSKSNNC